MKNKSTHFSTLDQFPELGVEELKITNGGDTHLMAGLWNWFKRHDPYKQV